MLLFLEKEKQMEEKKKGKNIGRTKKKKFLNGQILVEFPIT